MGCCLSSGEDGAKRKLIGKGRVDVQRVNITTPVSLEVPIDYPCTIKIKLDARKDKSRTVEVSFLDTKQKKLFEDALESLFAARYTPQNTLSEQYWKTSTAFDRVGEITEPGMHHLVLRSSSIMSDKNVHIAGRIIKTEL